MQKTVLELRPNCELCDRDLPPASAEARVCSDECTFCASCGGDLQRRPIRPLNAWRAGAGRAHDPAGQTRRHSSLGRDEIASLVERLRDVPAAER